jgi:PmbA protein
MNSLGGFCYERHPYAQCYTSALLEDDGKQAMFHEAHLARCFSELQPEHCIDTSVEYAQKLLKGTPIKSGRYRVFFSPDQLASLFGVFSKMFSAKALVEGTHPLKDKIGKQVASPLLSLTDSPRAEEALYPELFDDEGFETQDNALIVEGNLNSLYHNSATASELDMQNTHNASRSPKGALGVGSTLKKIAVGNKSEASFKIQPVLEIFDMQGLHSGANPHSGHFSFGASGRLWQNGEIKQIVKGITVSGNFYQAIQEIEGLGDTLYTNTSKSFVAPLVCFSSLSVAGD